MLAARPTMARRNALRYSFLMKITIATPLYPPDVGGPSYYAAGLEEALKEMGHSVVVVNYGDLRSVPMGISQFLYLLRLIPHVLGSDAVIALDTASIGFPAAILCRMLRIPFVVRTGGDFLWEQYIERTHDLVPLPFFYDKHRPLSFKERTILLITKWTLARGTIVFSTQMQRDVWLTPYSVSIDRTHIVGNAIDPNDQNEKPSRKNFLWHVRPLALKNGERLHSAFTAAYKSYPDIMLDEGMLPREELLSRMRSAYAVILPSISEISPNYIFEALQFGKPFILTKYCGLAQMLVPYGLLVDPLSEDDISNAIKELASEEGYRRAVQKASQFSMQRSYAEIAKDFLHLIEQNV